MRTSRRFETTSWSLVLSVSRDDHVAAGEALADLCERYRAPVLSFVRSHGFSREEAEDLTQSFFATLVEKKFVQQADRSRGRFRSFLLTAVRNFLSNERDRRVAQKRGGDRSHVSLEWNSQLAQIAGPATPEQLFEKRWAMSVVQSVIDEMRAAEREQGRGEQFEKLLPLIVGEAHRGTYGDMAAEIAMNEGALRVAVYRQRLRLREHLRRTVAETVLGEEEVDDEIRFLMNALALEQAVDGH